LLALSLVIYIPAIQSFFGFANPGFRHFGMVLIATFLLLIVLEFIKHLRFGAYRIGKS
jgi:hypothetical protein